MAIIRSSWKGLGARAREIGDFQSRFLLTLFYFTLLVPFALLARVFGDPLRLGRPAGGTGWVEGISSDPRIESARRQF